MTALILTASAILGLLVGSFLNVVALRYNTGRGIGGRSFCFSCGHCLRWFELIPVLSWLIQRGRCRACSSALTKKYLVGELSTALVFLGVAARGLIIGIPWMNWSYAISCIFLWITFSLLIVIVQYDISHKIIPDRLSLFFGLLGFASLFFFSFIYDVFQFVGFHTPRWIDLVAGLIVPLPFFLLWWLSRGRWMGLGDPKLMVGIGFFLGVSAGFSSVMLAFWLGTLYILLLIFIRFVFRKKLVRGDKASIMKTELPFAPFLVIGFWLSLILSINFFA